MLRMSKTSNLGTEQSPEMYLKEGEAGNGGDWPKVIYKKGAWSKAEDEKLRKAVEEYGEHNWATIERFSGLARAAKNCRVRWSNHLKPNLKKCPITPDEERKILRLHSEYGNSWTLIASMLPGRSDNEVKNFWNKRQRSKGRRRRLNSTSTELYDEHYKEKTNASLGDYDEVSVSASADLPQSVTPGAEPHFLQSPSCVTASHKSSPTNHLTQTAQSLNTPTSRAHNLSTPQASQSCQSAETPLSTPHTTPRVQTLSTERGGSGSSAHTLLRKPPVLLTPHRLRQFSKAASELSPQDSSVSSGSALVPPDSPMQVPCSSSMASPRSPLKLVLTPRGTAQSAKMIAPTAESSVIQNSHTSAASSSAVQLKSPTTTSQSTFKLIRFRIPVSSDSCYQSNGMIPDSNLHLNEGADSPSASAPALSSLQYVASSCSPELTSSEPLPYDSSSFTTKAEPPSIQNDPPTTSSVNRCSQEAEAGTKSKILDALREAQARVRFLKKQLRQTRVSDKRTSSKRCSRKESFVSGTLAKTGLTGRTSGLEVPPVGKSSQGTPKESFSSSSSRTQKLIAESLRVNAPRKNSGTTYVTKRILRNDELGRRSPKARVLLGNRTLKDNIWNELQKRENSGIESCTRNENTDTEELTKTETSETKLMFEESVRGGVESLREGLKRKCPTNLPEQRCSTDSLNGNLCLVQASADKHLNELTRLEGLVSENSAFFQDSVMEDLLGQTSGTEGPSASEEKVPSIDAFNQLYYQSTSATLVATNDEGGQPRYLQSDGAGCLYDNFGLQCLDGLGRNSNGEQSLIEGNRAETPNFSFSSLLQHQHLTSSMLDANYMGNKLSIEYGCSGDENYPLQTSGMGNSAETYRPCESSSFLHQYSAHDMVDASVANNIMCKNEYPGGEQHTLRTSQSGLHGVELITECTSSRNLQEALWGQSLTEGLLVDNSWHIPSQEQKPSTSGRGAGDGSSIMTGTMEYNWNTGSSYGDIEMQNQGLKNCPTNIMSDELSSLVGYFPTSIQTPGWYMDSEMTPGMEACDEYDMDIRMSLATPPPITITDYI